MNTQQIESLDICGSCTHVLLRLYATLEQEQQQVFKRNGKSPKFLVLEDKMYTIRADLAWRKTKMEELAYY